MGVDASLDTSLGTSALLSPDGKRLASCCHWRGPEAAIYVRSLDALQATALSGRRMPASFLSPVASGSAFSATAG